MKIPAEITQMNRGQILVAVIGIFSVLYILVDKFFVPDNCLGRMCPANDYTWIWQVGIVVSATAIAYWLLKSEK